MSATPQLVAVRPVPASEPVRGAEPPSITQGSLALQFQLAPEIPAVPAVPALRLVPPADGAGGPGRRLRTCPCHAAATGLAPAAFG